MTLFNSKESINNTFTAQSISTPAQKDSKVLKTLKVAAYCRVSTLFNEQEDSLQNQSVHYTNYIRSNPGWKFVGIYSDQGKSGTMLTGRKGLKKLIRHCVQGKIDLILCKSVSRFARNVLDTVDKVRMLKENGVRVVFEKEDIDTGDMQSEFILTMMAAVAQEESRSISENISWGIRKRFLRGNPRFYRQLGYNEGWIINEKEAAIVKEAYALCLKEKTPPEIASLFIRKGYKTARGNNEWSGAAIRDILRSERYVGDVLCQKTFVQDHLDHKLKRNKGEKSQYLVSNHHDPIIDRETFDKVQKKLLKRSKPRRNAKKKSYPLSARIICANCGSNLHRFTNKEKITWRCGTSVKSKALCQMKGVKETDIVAAMSIALNNHENPIKELKNVEASNDIEYNQLKLDLERILFEENMAIINSRANVEELKSKRIKLEKKLKEKEKWWELLELDYEYRQKALEKIGTKIGSNVDNKGKNKANTVNLIELNKTKYLRAWVVRITALSPFSFALTWVTGEEIIVERGEIIDHVNHIKHKKENTI